MFFLNLISLQFTKCVAAIVQERPLFKKCFFNPNFAAIIQERPLFESDRYWRGYGIRFDFGCLYWAELAVFDNFRLAQL